MYRYLFLIVALFPFIFMALWPNTTYYDTRKQMSVQRRLALANYTTLSKKTHYIKEAIMHLRENNISINIGNIAYEMNVLEPKYRLPYSWGGDIRDFKEGFDCTGFIHGLMYFTGEKVFKKRFNTYSLYKKLLHTKKYKLLYKSTTNDIADFNLSTLRVGDIIIWPSGVMDTKNLPVSPIFGHIGVVSHIEEGIPYVTHCVRSDAYNSIDIFPIKGAGINTLDAKTFITLKQRGVLHIFRKVR